MDVETKGIETLLEEVRKKREGRPGPVPRPEWRESFGAVPDDELSREAARLGEEWRAEENRIR